MRSADDFWIVSSGCDRDDECGGLGVELWKSKKLPYATVGSRELCFSPPHIKVIFAPSRILLVRICAPALRIVVAVAHAPHIKRPVHEK
eukprot:851597-Pyramimonas_sp.AAC.1